MRFTIAQWLEVAKIGGAVLVFLVGLWQYRKTQAWKRLEFVAAEMRTFYDDPAVKAAMVMLDWRKKEMALYKFRGENDLSRVIVDYDLVAASLRVDHDLRFDMKESAIRDIFERFLEFLARFEGFLEARLVKQNDFNPYLDYWVRLIAGQSAHSPELTRIVLPALWSFIDFYGYRDVRKFIGRYHAVAFPERSA